MGNLVKLLLCAIILCVNSTLSEAATFYVSKNGSDSNSCSSAQSILTSKLTIGSGAGCLKAGDTLLIRSGTYAESIKNPPSGISWTSPVTISSYSGEEVIVKPGNSSSPLSMVYTGTMMQYIIFEKIIFDGSELAKFAANIDGVNYSTNIHHVRWLHCEFRNAFMSGILTGRGANFLEFIKNKVHHNGKDDQFDHGAYFQSSDCIVDGGEYYNNASSGIQIYTGLLNSTDRANRNVVKNAIFHHNKIGLILGSGDRNVSVNNLIYLNRLDGVKTGFTGGKNTRIINNTIWGHGNNGIEVRAGIPGVVVHNNISVNNLLNLYDTGSGTKKSHNILTGDPLFVDSNGTNFRLKMGSPAIDAGLRTDDITVDIIGNARLVGANIDIGAYEFNSSGLTIPLAPTNVRVGG